MSPPGQHRLSNLSPASLVLLAASFAILILTLAMYAALLPQGQWYDEYIAFYGFRVYGWQGFLIRLLHWSPRPVSEILAFGYARIVYATGRPLIAPVLCLAWSVLFAFLVAALRPWQHPGRPARAAMVLALPASVPGHRPGQRTLVLAARRAGLPPGTRGREFRHPASWRRKETPPAAPPSRSRQL